MVVCQCISVYLGWKLARYESLKSLWLIPKQGASRPGTEASERELALGKEQAEAKKLNEPDSASREASIPAPFETPQPWQETLETVII